MSDSETSGFSLSHCDLVALYMVLSSHEDSLDTRQEELLERVASRLYQRLSVSQMEDIESYYHTMEGNA